MISPKPDEEEALYEEYVEDVEIYHSGTSPCDINGIELKPLDVVCDPSGNLYVVCYENKRSQAMYISVTTERVRRSPYWSDKTLVFKLVGRPDWLAKLVDKKGKLL